MSNAGTRLLLHNSEVLTSRLILPLLCDIGLIQLAHRSQPKFQLFHGYFPGEDSSVAKAAVGLPFPHYLELLVRFHPFIYSYGID